MRGMPPSGARHAFGTYSIEAPPAPQRATPAHPAVVQRYHPLQESTDFTRVEPLEQLKRLDPNGKVEHLIHESTAHAKKVMDDYRQKHGDQVVGQSGMTRGEADAMMLKSLLSLKELHKTGLLHEDSKRMPTDEEAALINHAEAARESKAQLAEVYGLSDHELRALEAYSGPNKQEEFLEYAEEPGKMVRVPNEHYMGQPFGPHKDGWEALGSAMEKVPNLGQLGLNMTTYRVPRDSTEFQAYQYLPEDSRILHGANAMDSGQKHFMSTSATYSVHLSDRKVAKSEGVTAITGESGVYMNPFGVMSTHTDGGEVLYPPGTMTRHIGYEMLGHQPAKKPGAPVHHLHEDFNPRAKIIVDDKDFSPIH
ncbi:MAG: hypothetical protein AAGF23_11670 [Acidobacteriota bacterium]